MSFLPYGTVSFGTWFGAMGGSAVAHAVFVGGLLLLNDANAAQPTVNRTPSFTITLEQLDTDALMGITDSTGSAAEADPATPESLDPVSASDTPDPDTIATEPETLAPETPDDVAAEAAAPVATETEPEALPAVPDEPPAPQAAEAAEPDPLAAIPPEPPQAPEVAEPAAPELLAPESLPLAEPAIPAPVLPTPPEQSLVVPDTLAALPSPVVPQAVTPQVQSAAVLTAQPVQPLHRGISLGAVPLETGAAIVQPPVPTPDGTIEPLVASSNGTATALAPLNARPQPAAQPSRPQPPRPAPSAQDIALGDLIQRIRSALADPCLIALPRRDGPDGVGLALIAAQDGAMEQFAQGFLTPEDSALRQTRTLVNALQCPALTYVRQNADYPATRMGLALDRTELASGERLTGVLNGGAGRFVTLLLIDDNGVVQDLQRFMAFSGNLVRFDVPVTRNGPSRDTKQIVLAIGTNTPPGPLRERAGRLAADVFLGLPDALSREAALALATIDVR